MMLMESTDPAVQSETPAPGALTDAPGVPAPAAGIPESEALANASVVQEVLDLREGEAHVLAVIAALETKVAAPPGMPNIGPELATLRALARALHAFHTLEASSG